MKQPSINHSRGGEVKFGEQLTVRAHLSRSILTSGPGIFWVTVFLLVPLVWIGVVSFLTRGEVGGYGRPFTFENYTRFAGFGFFGFDLLYPQIILRSLVLGAGTAVFCMLAALPLAFFIAGLPARYKNLGIDAGVDSFLDESADPHVRLANHTGPGKSHHPFGGGVGVSDGGITVVSQRHGHLYRHGVRLFAVLGAAAVFVGGKD